MKSGDVPQVRSQSALAAHHTCGCVLNASATFGVRFLVAASGVHAWPASVTGCRVAVPESR